MNKERKSVIRLKLKWKERGPQVLLLRENLYKCIWEFRLSDADDHPSVPHAHAVEYGFRLNVWTGEVYPAGNDRKNVIGHLKKSELSSLYKNKAFLNFAARHIEWYRKEKPYINFYVPDWFKLKYLRAIDTVVNSSNKSETEALVFVTKTYINDNFT